MYIIKYTIRISHNFINYHIINDIWFNRNTNKTKCSVEFFQTYRTKKRKRAVVGNAGKDKACRKNEIFE